MSEAVVQRYLRLGLALGRHVEGIVDAYYGPRELAAAVESEPPVEPRALVAEADSLLEELDDGWLRDQVAGVRTYAGVLAGETRSYADEVEGCFGVRPVWTDEAVFSAAHERLGELLPGEGAIAERYARWRAAARVPAEHVERTAAAVIEAARAWTRRLVELPDGEGVELELVRDVPWLAFCEYRGGLSSLISVNVDLPVSGLELLRLALHETYPGHHTERAVKEHVLVRGRGLLEETIALVPTPQSLVSEAIAELAPELLLEGEAGAALVGVLRDAGVELDLEHALAVERAAEPCEWAAVNAALLLHEEGGDDEQVREYVRRWGLATPQEADHLLRFLADPTSRTYVLTYPAGRALARAYVGGDPARFRRLLGEQVRAGELLEARGAVPAEI